MSRENNYSLADLGAVFRGNSGFGFGNDLTSIIVLFIIYALFGWGGFGGFGMGGMGMLPWMMGNNGGYGGYGAADNYVLTSDFAQLSRQMESGFASQERRTDSIINGICDLGYTQQSLANNLGMTMMQNFNNSNMANTQGFFGVQTGQNALARQISDCCCENGRQMERGFCDVQQTTHNDADRIIARIDAMETGALRDKLAKSEQENLWLKFIDSQKSQTAQLAALYEHGKGCC